jgi:hypothetical protein
MFWLPTENKSDLPSLFSAAAMNGGGAVRRDRSPLVKAEVAVPVENMNYGGAGAALAGAVAGFHNQIGIGVARQNLVDSPARGQRVRNGDDGVGRGKTVRCLPPAEFDNPPLPKGRRFLPDSESPSVGSCC